MNVPSIGRLDETVLPRGSARSLGELPNRRHYIQGLRAVAVLMVVLFHAGFPLPGGFVGVDVFFVVSGYVITAMLEREWRNEGRIRLGRFYIRRFMRLTPALAVAVGATALVAALLFSPEGSQYAARTGAAAILLSANWYIARTTGGYFGHSAETNPLLNTWSLSVEEQFYLFFPTLLAFGWAASRDIPRLRQAPLTAVAGVGVLSFMAAVFGSGTDSISSIAFSNGFYGPLGRAWEFAVGAALALRADDIRRTVGAVAVPLSLLGSAALFVSAVLINQDTPFPGPWALAPTLGTGLLLLFGDVPGTRLNRLLSSPLMVQIGDWSYSIYLWHWPCIVLASLLWPGRTHLLPAAAIVSLVPALFSYHYIEQPTRRIGALNRPRISFSAVAVTAAALLTALVLSWLPNSYWLPKTALANASASFRGEIEWRDHDYRFGGFYPCDSPTLREMVEKAPNYATRCQQSKPGPNIDVALIGDSHVEHLFIGVSEALPSSNILYFAADDFPSLSNPEYKAAVDYITSNTAIEGVVLTAFWSARPFERDEVVRMLTALAGPGKWVAVTDGLPWFPFSPWACKYRSPSLCSISADQFWSRYAEYAGPLRSIASEMPGVDLVETARYLCGEETCSMTRGDEILYADQSHLNVLGSRYVGGRLALELERIRSSRSEKPREPLGTG